MAIGRKPEYYSPEKRQQRREAARKANAIRYGREYTPEQDPYWLRDDVREILQRNPYASKKDIENTEYIEKDKKIIEEIKNMMDSLDVDYTSFAMIQSEIEDFDTDILIVSDRLKQIKEEDRQKLEDALNGAIQAYGEEAVAKRCEEHASEILDIVNSVLYDSGSESNKNGPGRSQYNAKIAEFVRLVTGSSMNIVEAAYIHDKAERLNEGE